MAFLHIFVTGYRDKQNRQRENINTMYMFFQKFFPYVLSTIFLVINFIFLEQFKVHSKLEEGQRFPIYITFLYICRASPIINIPNHNGTFVKTDKSTLTHCNQSPKFRLKFKVHFWCCKFYGFWGMHSGMYPPLYYMEYF